MKRDRENLEKRQEKGMLYDTIRGTIQTSLNPNTTTTQNNNTNFLDSNSPYKR